MPTVFLAGLVHETNTFLETGTSLADFEGRTALGMIACGEEMFNPEIGQYPIVGMIEHFNAENWQIIPGLWATTEPGGIVAADVFELLAGEIISRLQAAGTIDAVCVDMHGAMVVEGIDDAEGELLMRIRNVVGEQTPVVGALDLHGNISADSVLESSALVAYRCYPHTDMHVTGVRAAKLILRLHEHGKSFYKKHMRLPFLMPIHRQTTLADPCKAIYEQLAFLEQMEGVESLSFLPGFPLADIVDVGPTILGFGTDAIQLEKAVESLYRFILEREKDFDINLYSAAEGVAQAIEKSKNGCVLIADVQDNAGGGGTSDTTWVLSELIRQKAPDAILGLMFDPDSALAAHEAGVGAKIELSLGGKAMVGHSPVEAVFEVEQLSDEPIVLTGPMSKGMKVNLGKVALLKVDGIRVVVTSIRTQCHDTQYFRQFGIDPAEHAIIVVKSAGHYRADFCPLVTELVEIEADGACRMNPARITYHKLPKGMRLYGAGPEHS